MPSVFECVCESIFGQCLCLPSSTLSRADGLVAADLKREVLKWNG